MAATPFEVAGRLIDAGQISEARRALKSELRMRPNHVEARYNLALLLQEIGHSDDAISLYKKNLTIAWHLPTVVNLAQLLTQQAKVTEARQWLNRATKKIPYESAPWYLLAALAEKNADWSTAKSHYHKAVKVDVLNGFAWLYLAEFKWRQKFGDHGLKDAAKAMRLLPRCAPCWKRYGDLLEAESMHQQALTVYQRSLAIHAADDTRAALIVTLRSLGEKRRADDMQRLQTIGK